MIPQRKSDTLMNLQTIGQSLWMDHIGRENMYDGTLMQHMEEWPVTGLSLSPQAFCRTLETSSVYDRAISRKIGTGMCGEPLAFSLMLDDARYGADMLRHVFDLTDGIDGWVVLPCSPLKMDDPEEMMRSIVDLHGRIRRPNVLITVPGLARNEKLIRDLLSAGIPLNISLICSKDQYLEVAGAYLESIEKRIECGLYPAVPAFISIPVSHLAGKLAREAGIRKAVEETVAAAQNIYRAMRTLHTSRKWERAYNSGARLLRLIWNNSTGERPQRSEQAIVGHLVAPLTVTSMSARLLDVSMGSAGSRELMSHKNTDVAEGAAASQDSGDGFAEMAASLQEELAQNQVKRWIMLLDVLAQRSATIVKG